MFLLFHEILNIIKFDILILNFPRSQIELNRTFGIVNRHFEMWPSWKCSGL